MFYCVYGLMSEIKNYYYKLLSDHYTHQLMHDD